MTRQIESSSFFDSAQTNISKRDIQPGLKDLIIFQANVKAKQGSGLL